MVCNTGQAVINYYNNLSGDTLKLSDIKEYYIENFVLPEWKDKFHKLFLEKNFWKTVTILDECQYYINKLIEDDFRVVFITSTEPYNYYKKSNWLHKMFAKINLKDSLVSLKDKQLMSAYVDVLIDDYPKNLEDTIDDYGNSLKANYKKIIFDYNGQYTWTKKFECNNIDTFRATNWEEVYKIIIKLFR